MLIGFCRLNKKLADGCSNSKVIVEFVAIVMLYIIITFTAEADEEVVQLDSNCRSQLLIGLE